MVGSPITRGQGGVGRSHGQNANLGLPMSGMAAAAGGVESARSRSKTKKATNIFIPVSVNQPTDEHTRIHSNKRSVCAILDSNIVFMKPFFEDFVFCYVYI